MKTVFNPYLPINEYVPDGEPHVFGNRLYIYGSHDRANGEEYCEQDYVCWSTPISDLSAWRCEGIIYRKNQDPSNPAGDKNLWAPDVTQGPDGRFYLYYCLNFYPEIGVAVADRPEGPFEFYGHVHYPKTINEGRKLAEFMPFDPAVFTDDDGRVFLYYGFCPGGEKELEPPKFSEAELATMPPKLRKKMETIMAIKFGEDSMVAELEDDMLTLKEVPRPLIPGAKHEVGTSFVGHAFFEASSLRKFHGKYYFVYSSYKSHELCYATSDYPDRDFIYGGTIISNGDIGLQGRQTPVNTLGNNHGGLVEVAGDYYIFYHRQTNGTEFSRQGCAEKVNLDDQGRIEQVAITSCGLNGGPLLASGSYPAVITCHLTSLTTMDKIDYDNPVLQKQTRIVEQSGENFVADITQGTILGYKYFDFTGVTTFALELRGNFQGQVELAYDEIFMDIVLKKNLEIKTEDWVWLDNQVVLTGEKRPLYLRFTGEGSCALKSLKFSK